MSDVESISKYKLVGRLGRGGMAEVYLAVTQGPVGFTKLQVVKMLHSNLLGDSDFVNMFMSEARLAALLNHPNVVQTNEVGLENGRCFIVMEYLEGQALSTVLASCKKKEIPLGMTRHLRVIAEVLAGLHYAHELTDLSGEPLGLVHRDVTPHNVFVGYDGGVKLLDFGIAKATATSPETRSDLMKGKVRYMAPEQVSRETLDRRADIFQVGVMFAEAVTGKQYWPKTLPEMVVLTRLLQGNLPAVEEFGASVDEDLAQIWRKALARNPEDRYATADEFRLAIEAAIAARDANASSRQVGTFVAGLFPEHRARVKKEIEESLRTMKTNTISLEEVINHSAASIPELATSGSGSHTMTDSSVGDSSNSSRRYVTSASVQGAVASSVGAVPRKRPMIAFGIGGAVALAIGIFAIPKLFDRSSAPTGAPSVTASQTAVSTPSQPTPIPSPAATADDKVEIRISVEPSSADLYLDGERLPGNPFTGRVSKDQSTHKIKAVANGYAAKEVETTWDKSPSVSFTLEAAGRRGPAGPAAAPPPRPAETRHSAPAPALPKINEER